MNAFRLPILEPPHHRFSLKVGCEYFFQSQLLLLNLYSDIEILYQLSYRMSMKTRKPSSFNIAKQCIKHAYFGYKFEDEGDELTIKHFPTSLDRHVYGKYLRR